MVNGMSLSWLSRLKAGLSRSSSKISEGVTAIFTQRKLDDEALEKLEELLIEADLGVETATAVMKGFAARKFDKEITPDAVKQALAAEVSAILTPAAKPITLDSAHKPLVIMLVGVNGNGKTTTIGKIAQMLKSGGSKVMLAAADTFRAAAVEQISVWAQRVGVPLISGAPESDPASVAFEALTKAKEQGVDVLLIDTAGRLQNKSNLMAELQKIVKVLKKVDETAPHHVVQVLDATTGQNALSQVGVFKEMVQVSGLVITKLDGTAKGGIVVALARKYGLPIHAVGVGEAVEDLHDFTPEDFARNLVGMS